MSYILDALRKSDQQRQRGASPTLLAPQAAAVVPRRRVSRSHVLLTAVVLVGAGIVIGALRPWQTEQTAPATQAAAMNAPASSPRPSPVPVQPQMARKSEPQVPARKPAPAAQPNRPDEEKVLTIAELPLSIQREIPAMSISVHAYARASKDRLVSINDRVLREGDYLAPGLRLEQITPKGMILRFKGYRFRRGAR
jgi:general secretion pathway protein B